MHQQSVDRAVAKDLDGEMSQGFSPERAMVARGVYCSMAKVLPSGSRNQETGGVVAAGGQAKFCTDPLLA